MFTFILISLILLPVVFLPLVLTSFSSTELDEMGICLENVDSTTTEVITCLSKHMTPNMHPACGSV